MKKTPQKYQSKKGGQSNAVSQNSYILLFYVFHNNEYLGWDCFSQDLISAGSGEDVDLKLSGSDIHELQAKFYFLNGKVVVSDETDESGVKVNGKAIKTSSIAPLDVVDIGAYTIKVKLKKQLKSEPDYKARGFELGKGAGVVHKTSEQSDPGIINCAIETSVSSNDILVGGVDPHDLNLIFENQEEDDKGSNEKYRIDSTASEVNDEDLSAKVDVNDKVKERQVEEEVISDSFELEQKLTLESKTNWPEYSEEYDDEDDEEEEDESLDFLKEVLCKEISNKLPVSSEANVLEVIKYKDDCIVDTSYLEAGKKYYSIDEKGKFLIAENKSSQDYCFYFNKQFEGNVYTAGGFRDLAAIAIDENISGNSENAYSYSIPRNGKVVLHHGIFNYHLRQVVGKPSPQIADTVKEETNTRKNLSRSAAIHFGALFLLGIFVWLKGPPEIINHDEPRFVHFDEQKLKPAIPSVKKKKVVEPVQEIKKEKTKSITKKKKKLRKKRRRRKVAKNAGSSKGGSKKGNVSNRDIRQTGLLAAIGLADGFDLSPNEAVAAVTNLDVVSTSHPGKGRFKVGGIVSKLGEKGISAPSAGLVSTKGSAGALRSAAGNGRLASLVRGSTGKGDVKGLVSAKLNKSVRVRGGISREAVKRVIDQHLDEVSYCYESALMLDPSLMGKVIFEWKIMMSGNVGEIKTKFSSIKSDDVNSCIKSAIKSWRFPKPRGREVAVSYPFIFDIVGF